MEKMMNVGDKLIKKERDKQIYQFLVNNKNFSKKNEILDFGCGEGFIMEQLVNWGADHDQLTGVDISKKRIKIAKSRFESLRFLHISDKIPFSDDKFTIIVISTVFSSIIGNSNRVFWAQEIDRVLKKGGAIIFYDMKLNNPFNFKTKKISKRELQHLFKNYSIKTKSLTVIPQLSRIISLVSPNIYPFLTKLRFLHTHFISELIRENN
tara:strand:+ start:100 stop:726 length:627 start_codon:yes stop_codon:yes gene_type:complete